MCIRDRLGALAGAAEARGKGDVQHVLAGFQQGREHPQELLRVDLGGGGHGPAPELGVKFPVGHLAAAGDVVVGPAPHHVAEGDYLDVQLPDELWGQVRGGIGDNLIGTHGLLLPARQPAPTQILFGISILYFSKDVNLFCNFSRVKFPACAACGSPNSFGG